VRLRKQIDQAEALEKAGGYKEGVTQARAIVAEARKVDYSPVRAEALYQLGVLDGRVGDAQAAEATLRDAIFEGARAHDDALIAQAWTVLSYNLGRQARYTEVLAVRPAAEAAVLRAGDPPLLRAQLLASLATVLDAQDKYAEARPLLEQAIALEETTLGREHPMLAGPIGSLANVLAAYGHFDEAQRAYDRAIAIIDKKYGPHHPQLAITFNNMANALADQRKYERARDAYLRAIGIWSASLGEDAAHLAYPLNNLGGIEIEVGRLADARQHFTRALAIFEKTLGPTHPDLGMTLSNLGDVSLKDHKPAEARGYFARALAIEEKALPPDDLQLAFPLTGIGQSWLDEGRSAEAIPPLERARHIRERTDPGKPYLMADTQFALAQALLRSHREHARAIGMAEKAEAALAHAGPAFAKDRDEIRRWLAAQR
jgi:serine/threonine-protein kinase